MAKQELATTRIEKPKVIYPDKELEEFNAKFIEPYREMRTLEYFGGEVVRVPNWEKIYFKAGIKSQDGRVRDISELFAFEEKYRQWQAMMDRRERGQEQKMLQLGELNKDIINLEQAYKDF